ncbi:MULTISPECIES: AraC family transcriptional regulator [Achromobacter]|uniref:Helix-turn-helix transcriptional regulator n=1 Tax=Achromobacter spanius TaxID=217203 RepID=A0ABY8GYP0_9BURK|nr:MULTISPECIES: helix-turn-helix transcriptional regulator [Achromobacter]WAI81157.1 helix-turn-helix transcriptional regulator [Achromobacter spanius]WEX96675.1 helix-turn-helix transcriptional regulator [Achromobacter sp. SS2-2022]WFP09609.1 helix-turn-helix transcriptional regulator [Achromobacter spanius]
MTTPLLPPERAQSKSGPTLIAVRRDDGLLRDTAMHQHARGQLLGAYRGLLTVYAGARQWVVPSAQAVWIPPGQPHGLRSHGPYAGYSAYLSPAACSRLPTTTRVLQTSALLLAAVDRAASWNGNETSAARGHVLGLIQDELCTLPLAGQALIMPGDPRLQRLAVSLSDNPSDTRSLDAWAAQVGMAPRTFARRFLAETGLPLGAWRQQARLMRAQEMLAAGSAVTTVALELGYDNISAFIAMFKREVGITPGRFRGPGV